MTLAQIVAMLIRIAGPDCHGPCKARAAEVAPIVKNEAKGVPHDIVGTIMFEESSFINDQVGLAGELGLMQIAPTGRATRYCVDLMNDIANPATNIRCAVRLLKEGLRRCQSWPGSLTWYHGGACKPTRYSTLILERMAASRRPALAQGRK